jgi:hypothetical protein
MVCLQGAVFDVDLITTDRQQATADPDSFDVLERTLQVT